MDRRLSLLSACLIFVTATLACDRAAPAPADAASLAELNAFELTWAKAAVERDRATLDRLMAAEWTITLADGRRSDKSRALARWTTPPGPEITREVSLVDSVDVRLLGPDAAVVTAAVTDIEVRAQSADTARTRVTDVLVRRDGRWQAIVSHESIRPPASSAARP